MAKTRAQLPHLFYPPDMQQTRIINPHAFGGGGSFSPLDIAGCTVWLDASDSTTLFDATSGGSLPADEGEVERIEDKSGNSYHFTGTTGPIRKTAEINGLDALRFSGDYLVNTSNLSDGTCTIFFVGSQETGEFGYFFDGGDGSSRIALGAIGSFSTMDIFQGESVLGYSYTASATNHVWSFVADSTDKLYEDGSLKVSGNAGSHTLGSGMVLGARFIFTNGFVGNFAEMIIYDTALSDSDRGLVESYLATKWGL